MPLSDAAPALDDFSRLRVWERDGQRAPHKPLLALLALGRWAQGDRAPLPFTDIEPKLRDLLIEFGPPRKSQHPEFPFWYLRTDKVWTVTPDSGYPPRKGHASPSAKQLRDAKAVGQFTPEVRAALDRNRVSAVARTLLAAHFPLTVHEDIATAVGLDLDALTPVRVPRSRAFREGVLVAYRYSCAVCRVGVWLGHAPVGVEAAHIRWHASGGPDEVTNGLCLCSLHHKLFDRGAMTLSPDGQHVWVSEHANGRNVERALGRYHGKKLARPKREADAPGAAHIAWHHREVFRPRALDA